jgi:hypothetical protein
MRPVFHGAVLGGTLLNGDEASQQRVASVAAGVEPGDLSGPLHVTYRVAGGSRQVVDFSEGKRVQLLIR